MQTADFSVETAELNRRRLRVLAPLMALLHIAHVELFHVPAAERAALAPDFLRWRHGIVMSHAVMIPLALALTWVAWRARRQWLIAIAAPVMATAYIVHGALCSGFDQLVHAPMTPFVGYSLGVAVIAALSPAQAIVAYLIGAATMATMIATLQPDPSARLASLPNVVSVSVIAGMLSWMMYAGRRREHAAKRIIDAQRRELEALNSGLERRVQEQVAQLQAQVVARSSELSLALGKISMERGDDGALPLGTLLGDRFELEEILGEGGMGAVYRGIDRSSGGQVAIKIIQATSTRQLDALRRFIREAGATATLTHPAVVRMLHVDVSDEGLLYQVQELVDGETLTRRLARKWPPGEAARLCAMLAEALADAHTHGVVHRDVKPDNVMLTAAAPGMKLLDFGIAKLYDAVSAGEETTRGGLVLGTPAYMAPEQVGGEGEVGDRADVYAVGVILFRLLTARGPFQASSPQEMMMRHVMVPAPDVRSVDAGLPEPLAVLIARALGKDPTRRPAAAELAHTLGAFADGVGAPALIKLGPASKLDVTVRARA